jgi:2-polyprenyl-3-methyl-5-hydroxy-6-metoxy-1,4-benzoquinol methylase
MTNKNFWEKNAQPWNRAIQSHLIESRKVTNPAIVKAITRHKPASVLDLGCGEGWIASQVLPLGIQYTGLDFSLKLIELARKSHPTGAFEPIGYDELIQGDWKSPLLYDVAVFNFSLFDENLLPLLRKVASVLKPHGAMIIQTLHPKTTLDPYQDGWRIEDFKTFPIPFEGTMRWYGRRLESWEKLFFESGLKIQETIEPLSPETKKPLSIIFSLAAK